MTNYTIGQCKLQQRTLTVGYHNMASLPFDWLEFSCFRQANSSIFPCLFKSVQLSFPCGECSLVKPLPFGLVTV